MRPGEYFFAADEIDANKGKEVIELEVQNSGDRPIQVGSHYHFFETNRQLKFDRARSLGKRLNIPSGTAVRFEPGQSHTVHLIDLGGRRIINGFNRLVEGSLDDPATVKAALERMQIFAGEADGEK